MKNRICPDHKKCNHNCGHNIPHEHKYDCNENCYNSENLSSCIQIPDLHGTTKE